MPSFSCTSTVSASSTERPEVQTGADDGDSRDHKCSRSRTISDPSSIGSCETVDEKGRGSDVEGTAGLKSGQAQVEPPPDGGRTAWMQVLMAHMVACNSWGYVNSFGVFQAHYVETLKRSPSDISWVGSVQVFLIFFIGAFSGRATDAGYFHHIFVSGCVCTLLGIVMTSFATEYWHLFLTQGLLMGIGSGLTFCPSLSVLSTYFSRKRALAISIAVAGAGMSGVIFPVVLQQLTPRIGFPWTVRVLALLSLVMAVIANLCSRPRLEPRKSVPLIEFAALKETPYSLFVLGMFLVFWGQWVASYFIGSYGQGILQLEKAESINLILMMNGVGAVSRLVPCYIADRWLGPLNTLTPFVLIVGIIVYSWITVNNHASLIAFAISCGLFSAGVQTLFPATVSALTTDLSKAGSRMGMAFTIVSFSSLTGPPIAGALIQLRQDYLYAQLFGGSALVAGFLVLCGARIAKTGWKFLCKV